MNQKIVMIADLSNFVNYKELENVAIRASVSIRSLRHGNSRQGYFYMDLRDDSGDIAAVVITHDEPCHNQFHIIQDNRTYIFTNFTLANSKKRYTSITHWKEIVLSNDSMVRLCGNAAKVEWPLTPFIKAYVQETELFNIVGLCLDVAETEVVLGELTRKVRLVDETCSEVTLNVWNQETALFDELDLSFQPVIFVKDARVYVYRGVRNLSTTRYLQLLDPDDPRAANIRKAIPQAPSTENVDRTVARYVPNPRDGTHHGNKRNRQVNIADLTDDMVNDGDMTIVATVTTKSITRTEDDQMYFLMDLRDDTGDICALVIDGACVKYQHLLQKNNTYSITDFSMEASVSSLTSINHRMVVFLKDDCDVKLLRNGPKVEWPISPLTEACSKNGDELFHIFGMCTIVEDAVYDKRRVTLVDQLRRQLILEVKDEEMATFDALDLTTHPVFFAKDARKLYATDTETVLDAPTYLELLDPDDPRARRVTTALGVSVPTSAENSTYETRANDKRRHKKK